MSLTNHSCSSGSKMFFQDDVTISNSKNIWLHFIRTASTGSGSPAGIRFPDGLVWRCRSSGSLSIMAPNVVTLAQNQTSAPLNSTPVEKLNLSRNQILFLTIVWFWELLETAWLYMSERRITCLHDFSNKTDLIYRVCVSLSLSGIEFQLMLCFLETDISEEV